MAENMNRFGYDNTDYNGAGEYRMSSQNIRQDGAAGGADSRSYNESSSSYSQNASGQAQQTPASEPAPGRKPHKMGKKGKMAWFLAGVIVLSVLCGAGGAVLASHLGLTGSQTVLYESTGTGVSVEENTRGVSAIVKQVEDSVVAITTEQVATSFFFQQYVMQGAGSGVILSADGTIVTNNHVIKGAQNIKVTLTDGTSYPAKVIGTDAANDIAVVKIDAKGLHPAVIGSSDSLEVGDFVLAIGNPLGTLSGTVTDGIVSALARRVTIDNTTMTLLQTSAAVNPGNSGGGLFNAAGELIGIVNAKSTSDSSGNSVDNIGFAIPIDSVRDIIDDLITEGYVTGRIVLGVNLIEIPDQKTADYYGVKNPGVYIQGVESGSIAELGGLRAGDHILTFGDTKITKNADLTQALKEHEVGDRVEVIVDRDGREYKLALVLTEYVPEDEN